MADQSNAESRGSGYDALGGGEHTQVEAAGPSWLTVPLEVMDRILRILLTLVMALMLLAALAQVTVRYALTTTLIGPEEVARYMMIAGTFLGIPVLAKSRNHIAVDALAHYLPSERSRRWLLRGILLVESLFLGIFSWYALVVVRDAMGAGGFSAGLEIPSYIPMLPLFVGALLGLLVTLALFIQSFYGGVTMGRDEQTGLEALS